MKPRKNNYMFIYSENLNLASQWLEHCKVPQCSNHCNNYEDRFKYLIL